MSLFPKRRRAVRRGSFQSAAVESPHEPTMTAVVRRFQGVYECGCWAHPLDGPDECEIHSRPKKYLNEPLQVNNVTVMEA